MIEIILSLILIISIIDSVITLEFLLLKKYSEYRDDVWKASSYLSILSRNKIEFIENGKINWKKDMISTLLFILISFYLFQIKFFLFIIVVFISTLFLVFLMDIISVEITYRRRDKDEILDFYNKLKELKSK